MINLSPKQSEAWQVLENAQHNEVFYGGGAGGGKSWLGCVWQIWRRTRYPGSRGFLGRKNLKDIEESTLVTFFNACRMMGYLAGEHYEYNSQKSVIKWANGSVTLLKELKDMPNDPDFNRLGSTEYTDGFIDEATEISAKAFDILNSRIRYRLDKFNLVPKILLTGNPGDNWIKHKFVMTADNESVTLRPYECFIPALLSDNPDRAFVDSYRKQLEKLMSDYDRKRLLDGDWEAQREVLNPFASHYSPVRHTAGARHQPNRQLIISVDFNLNPFAVIFAHIWNEPGTGMVCHIFDQGSIDKGSIPAMADLIKSRYGQWLITCKLTGDASGQKGDISQRDNASYYDQLQRLLGLRHSQVMVPPSNPSHENSRADVNYVLEYLPDFKISTSCHDLMRDFGNVQCDAFGTIIKRNRKDLAQRADFLDAARYLINTFLTEWVAKHKNRK